MIVEIIVPVWNRRENIQKTITCLLRQDVFNTMHRVHIHIVNDNSTDGTRDYLNAIRYEYDNLSIHNLLQHDKWNASIPRNYGAKQTSVKTNLLYFIDSDVLLPPDRVRRLIEVYEEDQDPNRVIIGPYHFANRKIDVDNPLWYTEEIRDYSGDIRWQSFLDHEYPDKNKGIGYALACFGGNLAIPRKLFFKAGGFDETMYSGVEDGDFGLTLWESGAVFSLDHGLLGWHNPHPIVPERTRDIKECVDRLNAKHNVDMIKLNGDVYRQWGIDWTPPESWIKEGGYTKEEL